MAWSSAPFLFGWVLLFQAPSGNRDVWTYLAAAAAIASVGFALVVVMLGLARTGRQLVAEVVVVLALAVSFVGDFAFAYQENAPKATQTGRAVCVTVSNYTTAAPTAGAVSAGPDARPKGRVRRARSSSASASPGLAVAKDTRPGNKADAVYLAAATFTTVGGNGITVSSGRCRALVLTETIMSTLFLAFGVALLVVRLGLWLSPPSVREKIDAALTSAARRLVDAGDSHAGTARGEAKGEYWLAGHNYLMAAKELVGAGEPDKAAGVYEEAAEAFLRKARLNDTDATTGAAGPSRTAEERDATDAFKAALQAAENGLLLVTIIDARS